MTGVNISVHEKGQSSSLTTDGLTTLLKDYLYFYSVYSLYFFIRDSEVFTLSIDLWF